MRIVYYQQITYVLKKIANAMPVIAKRKNKQKTKKFLRIWAFCNCQGKILFFSNNTGYN